MSAPQVNFTGVRLSLVDKRDAVLDTVLHLLPPPSSTTAASSNGDNKIRLRVPVYNQNNTNACVASSTVTSLNAQYSVTELNPIFLYNLRELSCLDGGASVRNILTVAFRYGCATYTTYGKSVPVYVNSDGNAPRTLSRSVVDDAARFKVKGFGHIYSKAAAIEALQRKELFGALPVVLPMYNGSTQFYVKNNNNVDNTGNTDGTSDNNNNSGSNTDNSTDLIYHCVTLVAYDAGKDRFLLQNSWGNSWGDRGCAWLPGNLWECVVECWFLTKDDRVVELIKDKLQHHYSQITADDGDLNNNAEWQGPPSNTSFVTVSARQDRGNKHKKQ